MQLRRHKHACADRHPEPHVGHAALAAPTTKLEKHTIFNAQEQSAKVGANTVRRRPNDLPAAALIMINRVLSQRDNVVYVLR
jgi:hypothetical protein